MKSKNKTFREIAEEINDNLAKMEVVGVRLAEPLSRCVCSHIAQHHAEGVGYCTLSGCDCKEYTYDPEKTAKYAKEIRTTSPTGGQKGVKPERMSLIPVEALEIMGRLYGFGEQKYAAHNWRKGYDWSKSYDSLQRHAGAFWRGEDYDEETGLPHLAGVVFHAFTLMIFMEEHPEFDDRYKKEIQETVGKSFVAVDVRETDLGIEVDFKEVSSDTV